MGVSVVSEVPVMGHEVEPRREKERVFVAGLKFLIEVFGEGGEFEVNMGDSKWYLSVVDEKVVMDVGVKEGEGRQRWEWAGGKVEGGGQNPELVFWYGVYYILYHGLIGKVLEKEVDVGGRHVIYGMMGIVTEKVMERLGEIRQSLVKGGEGVNEHLKVVDQAIEAIETTGRQLEEWLEEGEITGLKDMIEGIIEAVGNNGMGIEEGVRQLIGLAKGRRERLVLLLAVLKGKMNEEKGRVARELGVRIISTYEMARIKGALGIEWSAEEEDKVSGMIAGLVKELVDGKILKTGKEGRKGLLRKKRVSKEVKQAGEKLGLDEEKIREADRIFSWLERGVKGRIGWKEWVKGLGIYEDDARAVLAIALMEIIDIQKKVKF